MRSELRARDRAFLDPSELFTAIDELKFKQIEGRSSTSNSTCCIDVRLFTGNSFTCDIALDVVDQFLVIRNWILDRYCISLEIPITKDLLGRCVSAGVVLHLLDDIDTRSTSLYEHPDSRIAMDFCFIGRQRIAAKEHQTVLYPALC